MEPQTVNKDTEQEIEELKEEQNYKIPRSTIEMLEQTLQIA